MSHPIPNTSDSHSVQLILPQKQLNRRHGAAGACGGKRRATAAAGGSVVPSAVLATACARRAPQPCIHSRVSCLHLPDGATPPTPPYPTPPADIYVFCCSYTHNVAPKDKWVAFVSTTVETADPAAELAPGARGGGLWGRPRRR